jgi:hypothetical protein
LSKDSQTTFRPFANTKGSSQAQSQPYSPADEILKYKNLLDQGIITKEEFDIKKKKLLGL